MIARIKNLLSKSRRGVAAASGFRKSFDDDISNSNRHVPSPEMITKWKRIDAHMAILSIYAKAGLPRPLIISTQSPLESYIAKAAIDVFSDAGQPYAWHYRWRDRATDGCSEIRKNAARSILDSGWRMGHADVGYDAWCKIAVYEGGETILWEDIPPNSFSRFNRSDESVAWTQLLEGAGLSGTIDEAIAQCQNDMMIDIWARYRFQMNHIDRQAVGGSRSTHILMMRDKESLLCQKNLSFLPPRIAHPGTREDLHMTKNFAALHKFAGHIMPFTNICFVSEPARSLNLDDGGRLHCANGPAVVYPDGFGVCAWHGVLFPEKWIEKKPSAGEALRMQNSEQRRVAFLMIGWDNVFKQMKVKTLDKDIDPEIGALVSVNPNGNDEQKFLRVRCGTGRDFVLPVPPDMKTARQANAWTWGLDSEQYNPEVRT